MKRQEITVKAKQGIHATPAVVLVNQARSYKSDIKLYKGSNGIDMKNVLRVLGLAVRCDDTVVVEAEGEDEELSLIHIYPEIVILGGSVALTIDGFVEEVEALAKERVYEIMKPYVKVRKSTLNEDSGLIGAAYLAFSKAE